MWGVGEGEGGEARSVVFHEGLRLWEARFVVFHEGLRLWGGSVSNQPVTEGGSAKERPSRAWGEGEGGEARSVVFYEGLRLWEARFVLFYESLRLWGGSVSNGPVTPGGSAKEKPSRAWGEGEGGAGII